MEKIIKKSLNEQKQLHANKTSTVASSTVHTSTEMQSTQRGKLMNGKTRFSYLKF